MTKEEFRIGMDRLTAQFGKSNYSSARVEILAREVAEMPADWWRQTVDRFLGEYRQAPLLSEFREAKAMARERGWHREKIQHTQDAKDFWKSSYHPEEQKIIFQTIRMRIQGRVNDADWAAFMRGLQGVAS